MTIPNEAVQAMPERIYAVKQMEGSNCVVSFDTPSLDYNVEYVRAGLALPFLQGVKVKDLRWKGPDSSGEYHSLSGLWGYIIRCGNGNGYWLTEVGQYYPTPEGAKSAAQADYEARILSAIEVTPSPRAQALEEAAKLCEEYSQSYQRGLCHYGSADKDAGLGRQEGHINASNELAVLIRTRSSQPVEDEEQEAAKTLLNGNMVKLYDACSGICKVHKFKAVLEKLASSSALPASPGASE